MQTTSSLFQQRAAASMRPLSWRLLMSFEKTLNDDVDFFTIGESLIGGDDFIKGEGDVVQEWDKYVYTDYTDRVMALEWSRETDPYSSVSLSIADVVLNNYDDFFTPDATHVGHETFTLGKTSDGAFSTSSSADRKKVSLFTADFDGLAKTITIRMSVTADSTNVKAVIYSDSVGSPNALLAVSDEVNISNTVETDITFTLSGVNQIAISNGTSYWIGFHQQDPGTASVVISRDGNAGESQTNTDTYSNGPTDPFGAATAEAGKIDAYVTCDAFTQTQVPNDLSEFILPYRPIRLFAGFGNENVPVFIGLTERMPVIDEKNKTATFHCIDFLYSLLNRPLDETIMLENATTDECLAEIFESAGLLTTQYEFDVGFNTISFFYVEKGTKLIDVVKKLMEAEQGRLYMDELGMIRFKNRQNYDQSSVYSFTAYSNILDSKRRNEDDIVNVVTIKSKVRQVQIGEVIHNLAEVITVPAGEQVEKFFDYQDPVVLVNTPVFTANDQEDGEGSDVTANINIVSQDDFSHASKIVFENTGGSTAYIRTLMITGNPARVIKDIYVREEDTQSVAKYDERPLDIDNDFFSNEDDARSSALTLLQDYSEYGDIEEIEVKGTPALQLDDPISVNVYDRVRDYHITRISCKIGQQPTKFFQLLKIKKLLQRTYFTIGESLIGGDDLIAP